VPSLRSALDALARREAGVPLGGTTPRVIWMDDQGLAPTLDTRTRPGKRPVRVVVAGKNWAVAQLLTALKP
jgi:hypothetical protein